MDNPLEADQDRATRLERLRELNRKLDQALDEGDSQLKSLFAYSARAAAAAAIESQILQREVAQLTRRVSRLTVLITILTAIGVMCAGGQVYFARAAYQFTLRHDAAVRQGAISR